MRSDELPNRIPAAPELRAVPAAQKGGLWLLTTAEVQMGSAVESRHRREEMNLQSYSVPCLLRLSVLVRANGSQDLIKWRVSVGDRG